MTTTSNIDPTSPFAGLAAHPLAPVQRQPRILEAIRNPLDDQPVASEIDADVPEISATDDLVEDLGDPDPGEFDSGHDALDGDEELARLLGKLDKPKEPTDIMTATGIPTWATSMVGNYREKFGLPASVTDRAIFEVAEAGKGMNQPEIDELMVMLRDDPDADAEPLAVEANGDEPAELGLGTSVIETPHGHRVEFSDSVLGEFGGFTAEQDAHATEDLSGQQTDLDIPVPPSPRDPVADFEEEFISKKSIAHMSDQLRDFHDERLATQIQNIRTAILSSLAGVFSAKSLSGADDVAVYVAENSSFRDMLMSIYKLCGVNVDTVPMTSIELDGAAKIFISRAPRLVTMYHAAIHALTQIERWKADAEKLAAQKAQDMSVAARMSEMQAKITEAERGRQIAENLSNRLNKDLERVRGRDMFRIQWMVSGKNAAGAVVQKAAYLALRDTDQGEPRADGVWPGRHYVVTYEENASETFTDIEVAFKTLDFLRSQATRLMKVNGAFNMKFLVSATVVQWAQITHKTRPTAAPASAVDMAAPIYHKG